MSESDSVAAGDFQSSGAEAVGDAGPASPASPAASYSNGNGVSHATPGSDYAQPDEYAAPPNSWRRDVADRHWSRMDRDLREYLHQRESESHRAITDYGARLKGYEPYDGVTKEFADHFTKYGRQPHETFAELMRAHQYLDANPQAFLSEVAQRYGVDVSQLLPNGYPRFEQVEALAQAQTAWQQHAETLAAEVQQLRAALAEREKAWQASERKREVEAEKHAAEAQKAARINVRSSAVARHNPLSMNDTIEQLAAKHYR